MFWFREKLFCGGFVGRRKKDSKLGQCWEHDNNYSAGSLIRRVEFGGVRVNSLIHGSIA